MHDSLDDDDLETILAIAKNGQSGRITEREIKLLVSAYREAHAAAHRIAAAERESCAKIADERAAVCLDAANNYYHGAPEKATERCAHHEAVHIASLIRARSN